MTGERAATPIGELLVRPRNACDLATFVDGVASLLSITDVEKRSSAHYVDEEYYTSTNLSLKVSMYGSDDGRPDFPFVINVATSTLHHSDACCAVADLFARVLTAAGYAVAFFDSVRSDAKLFVYRLSANVVRTPVDDGIRIEPLE